MLPVLKRTRTITLDVDWLYRHVGTRLALEFRSRTLQGWNELVTGPLDGCRRVVAGFVRTHGPHGPLARTWPTGSMVLWVGVFLAFMLIAGILRNLNP
jgi:multicomponent Na+:H+ antiporter subunit D